MSNIRKLFSLLAGALAACAAAPASAELNTQFKHWADYPDNINWMTCGTEGTRIGCFGHGELGPFGNACAIMTIGNKIYVADSNNQTPTGARATVISVYKNVVSTTPSMTFVKKIQIPIAASSTAKCWMGALSNDKLFFGTDQSSQYFSMSTVGAAKVTSHTLCGSNTQAITSSGAFLMVDQGICIAEFDNNGPTGFGGNSDHTFVTNNKISTPLR